MAYYKLQTCVDSQIIYVNFTTTPNIGEVWSVKDLITNDVYCGVVIGTTTNTPTYKASDLHSDCYDCLKTKDIGIKAVYCDLPTENVVLSWSAFTESPTINQVYKYCFDNEGTIECFCIIIQSQTNDRILDVISNIGPIDSCFDCANYGIVYSAGTPYEACVICDGPSGTTVNSVSVPHPIWTRPDGTSVMLTDAVQLGGMFGLNS